MTHQEKCPNCGRYLTESEIYCYFCELDLSKIKKWHPDVKKSGKNR